MRLVDALGIEAARVVSICGAGGKTTLMFAAAREFLAAGERVLLTTTTKIAKHEAVGVASMVAATDAERILAEARRASQEKGTAWGGALIAFFGESADGQKLIGFSPEIIDRLSEDGYFDRILVEADGSARKPLKAPDAHEPVIPASTDALVIVAGLNGLGLPLDEATVFRAHLWAKLTGAEPGSRVDADALARVILHEQGLAKGCPERAMRALFLNRADQHWPEAERVVELLSKGPGRKPERVVSGCLLPKPDILDVISLEFASTLAADVTRKDGRVAERAFCS